MARLVFLLRRLPSLSREEFQHYWRTTHAPLVAARAEVLGIRRYQQVHTTRQVRPDTVPAFDGVAELWVDADPGAPVEDRRRAGAELLADERNFIDLSSSPLWMADEVVLREGPTQGERLTSALRRAPGLTRQEFLEHWQHVHAPLALEHNDVLGFTHYVQLHTPAAAEDFPLRRDRGAPAPFDGVAEIYREATRPSPDRRVEVGELIRQDETRFIDHGTSPVWLGRVERIV